MSLNISPALVKELREKTGAGMMDCKKALTENGSDIEASIDWLRKKGLAAASKKSGRVTSEGLVGILSTDNIATIVEINAETDFVGRNSEFQNFVKNITEILLKNECFHDSSISDVLSVKYNDACTINEELTRLISVIGENIQFRRAKKITASSTVSTYIHNSVTTGLGRIGVVVALKSNASKDMLLDLGKKIAMHIAAANPVALKIADVPNELLDREKGILEYQAKESGRPAEVIAKMIDGRIKKYFEEVVLLEQPYVMDPKTKVSDMLANISKECGHLIEIESFTKFTLGDGIEKEEKDFASEVQACMS